MTAFSRSGPSGNIPSVEYGDSTPLPPDWQRPGEWAFARLMYPPGPNDGYRGRFDGDWRLGMSLWTQDAPPADRSFAAAVRRLTRIDARSVEQDVNLDDGDEVYNWPWLYAVQVGEWGITQHQADVLRDYLLRGGFFMADDFHGAYEWQMFVQRIRMVFPDRPIVEIPDNDPIFHTHLRSRRPLPDSRRGAPAARLQSAGLSAGARRREGSALVRHPRRQGPHHGRHFVQFGSWRFMGVVRPPGVSRALLRSRLSHRRQLRRLCDDALSLSFARATRVPPNIVITSGIPVQLLAFHRV